jgi:hypothetical protein
METVSEEKKEAEEDLTYRNILLRYTQLLSAISDNTSYLQREMKLRGFCCYFAEQPKFVYDISFQHNSFFS